MDFNLKNYQIFKLKKYLKKRDLLFLFHSAKLNSAKWIKTEQNLKKLNLKYYKPLNKTSSNTLKNSIFANFHSAIGGFLLFVKPRDKNVELDLQLITKKLKPSFILVGVKLNNKIYSVSQLKGMNNLLYKKTIFNLYRTVDKYLKITYKLTNKPKISK